MRRLFLLLLKYFVTATPILTISNQGFSQFDSSQNIFYLKNLPPDGVLLDKGWKFQEGDNLDYAKPGFDDNTWQTINPTLAIYDQPAIAKSGICWLRLHMVIDSSLSYEQL